MSIRLQPVRPAFHHARVRSHHDITTESPASADGSAFDNVGQADRLDRLVISTVGRQLDQFVHQVGELARLTVEISQQLLARLDGQLVEAPPKH